jgi:transcriptional regulator GlxA family with amidase domain
MKRMLKGTDMPVKEIAYDMGFDEPTNMVKFFKKHTSLTPQGFRLS